MDELLERYGLIGFMSRTYTCHSGLAYLPGADYALHFTVGRRAKLFCGYTTQRIEPDWTHALAITPMQGGKPLGQFTDFDTLFRDYARDAADHMDWTPIDRDPPLRTRTSVGLRRFLPPAIECLREFSALLHPGERLAPIINLMLGGQMRVQYQARLPLAYRDARLRLIAARDYTDKEMPSSPQLFRVDIALRVVQQGHETPRTKLRLMGRTYLHPLGRAMPQLCLATMPCYQLVEPGRFGKRDMLALLGIFRRQRQMEIEQLRTEASGRTKGLRPPGKPQEMIVDLNLI